VYVEQKCSITCTPPDETYVNTGSEMAERYSTRADGNPQCRVQAKAHAQVETGLVRQIKMDSHPHTGSHGVGLYGSGYPKNEEKKGQVRSNE